MAKSIVKTITLEIEAGKANVETLQNTELASFDLDIEEFCNAYNNITGEKNGETYSVNVYMYDDNTFGFELPDFEYDDEIYNDTPEGSYVEVYTEAPTTVPTEPITSPQKEYPSQPQTHSSGSHSTSGGGNHSSSNHSSGGHSGNNSRNTSSGGSNKKEKSSNKTKTTSVNYDNVIASVNGIIGAINSTSILNNKSSYSAQNSTADLFGAMNRGENYLRSVSTNLLSQMSIGAQNVETMINNYAKQDSKLATLAQSLSNGYKNGQFSSTSPNYSTNAIQSFESLANLNSQFLNEYLSAGKVGKVSATDLKGILADKTTSLTQEIKDATNLNTSLTNLINSSDIKGEGWDAFKNILNEYKGCNDARSEAAQIMLDAYTKATNLVSDYMSPDENLDDGEIPEYEEKITQLQADIDNANAQITSLESENASLASVTPTLVNSYDEEGNVIGSSYDYTAYNAAQSKIASNNSLITQAKGLIETAKVAKEEAELFLEKLKGLAGVMSEANKIINEALTDIDLIYADDVYGIDTPRLDKARKAGLIPEIEIEIPENIKSSSDLQLITNARLQTFIEKYGVGKTVKIVYKNAKGEKVKMGVTLFGPNDTIGVGVGNSPGKNTKSGTIFDKYDADVVMNCALNSAPILLNGKIVKNTGKDYYTENSSHHGMEALCQKQDGTLVVVPYRTSSDPNGKNFVKRLQQGYVNENGVRENYKFAIGGYYNIVDNNGNYVNHRDGYLNKEHPRSMVLQTKQGYTYLIAADGRTGGTNGMTLKDMYNFATTNLCDKNDISIYYNGDGGSSTSYKYVDGNSNVSSLRSSGKPERRSYIYGISNG